MIRRRFGQHFLTDRSALARIVEALDPRPGETIVEIGPGRGALTDTLVERCTRLVCVEIDRELARGLRDRYAGHPVVSIVEGDVLATTLGDLAASAYSVVGNVPYYITTPILFHTLQPPRPARGVFLVQREVAERLVAAPGTPAYGALTVNMTLEADIRIVGRVGAGAFFPRPKVDSAIVRLDYRQLDPGIRTLHDAVRPFVVALFGQRRRQLLRALRTVMADIVADAANEAIQRVGIDPGIRAEALAPGVFVELYRALSEVLGQRPRLVSS